MSKQIQKPLPGTPLISGHQQLKGLVGWWLFREHMGDRAYDLSGYGNHGTLTNSPTWIGRGIEFVAASDQYITIPDAQSLDLTSELTITFWMKANTFPDAWNSPIGKRSGVNSANYIVNFRAGATDKIQVAFYQAGYKAFDAPLSTNMSAGVWHFFATTLRQSGGNVDGNIYIDGRNVESSSVAGTLLANAHPLLIANSQPLGGSEEYFDGEIDDVRVLERVKTQTEIQDIMMNPYAAFKSPSPETLYGYSQTYYPNRAYPLSPEFPVGHEDVPTGPELYTAVSSYIEDMMADIDSWTDFSGNIELVNTKGIEWDNTIRVDLSGGEIKATALKVNTELIFTDLTVTPGNLTIAGDLDIANDLTVNTINVTGTVSMDYLDRDRQKFDQEAEPGDPADNNAVLWISSGVGYGDAGDFCCKITEGGGTTDFTISDYSAL